MGMTELTVPAEPDGPSHDLGSVRELTKTGADLLPIRVQIHRKNVGRCDNKIVTAKYSLLPFPEPSRWFLPLFIYELLFPNKRFANFFYLGVGMLQMVKSINPSGFPSTWGSLFFILLVNIFTLTKDDLARHKADEDQNRQPVSIITASESEPGVVVERQGAWADVAVGDVVRVRAKEAFPADMVLLRGSDPPGTCWVSTKALDGESDMKLRLAPQHGLTPGEEGGKGEMDARWSDESMAADDAGPMSPGSGGQPSVLKSMSDLDDSSVQPKGSAASLQQSFRWSGLSGELRCEEPNDKVNDFLGEMVLGSGLKLPLTPANMLLRGCVLHNTEWVYGLVVSTGTDTKINFGGGGLSIQKRSIVTKTLNLFVLLEVLLCFFMCLIGAACGQLSYGVGPGEPWYILDGAQPDETRYDPFFQVFMFYFLILYSMLPATLFVSADVINLCTAWYIKNDIDLYHAEEDEPCQVRQMSLCDELGQVSHIFSDKTGTLTSNHMEFRRILIDGTSYGVGETAISKSLREMGKAAAGRDYTKPGEVAPAVDVGEIELRGGPLPPWAGCRAETDTFVSFEEASASTSLFEAIVADSDAARRNREILINLAVNHSVLLDEGHLSASSPDELAFVAAAEHLGFEFCERRDNEGLMMVRDKRMGITHTIKILAVFAYESSRKRMSVVVELPPELVAQIDGESPVRVYTKGADSILLSLLREGSRGSDANSMTTLSSQLSEWADVALRTLVFAKRALGRAEFDAWHGQYLTATSDPSEIVKMRKGHDNAITALQVELERDLELQGATAIEDKLQNGVPEVLADLRRAQIKLWMLTGDKVGTAKNIAMACNILPPNANVLELTTETYPVLGEVDALRMVDVQRKVADAERESAPADAPGGALGRFVHQAMRALGSKKADEAGRAAVAKVVHEQTERLDSKYPGLQAVRAALELRLRQMEEQGKAAAAGSESVTSSTGGGGTPEFCLVVDEAAIEYCATLCKDALAAVGDGARSVVACRARKDQKAQMLRLIRENFPSSCCLAIGDGANDVAMIKAGQIGVGIIGKEGMAAVNNSDFAIGQFRFLRGLLLVHGRAQYRRMALFNYYVLYKGTVLPAAIFFWNIAMAMGSASRPYLELYFVALYALFLTIAPIIVTAINDSDVPKAVAARTPELYTPGIRRVHFTLTGYLRWTVDALYAAAVSIFLPCLACNEDKDGAAFFGLHSISWLSMWLLTAGVNVRLFPEISSWSKLEYTSNGFSMFLLVFFGVLMSQVAFPLGTTHTYSWDWYNHFIARFFGVLEWWLTLFLGLFLFVLPVLIGRAWYSVKRPPPPMPPRTEQVRMPSLADVKVEPSQVRNSRVSMMQVPNEQIIEEERQQQEVRKSLTSMSPEAMVSLRELSLVKNAPPSAAASAAPADAPPDPTPRRQSSVPPSPGRGFAFSSSDQTSQHMWEVHNSSSLLRQRSLARGGSITSPGSTPLSERIDSERGRPVMPS